jgi:hypothetical protein
MLERKNKPATDETPFSGLVDYAGGKYFDAKIPVNDPDLVVKEALVKWRESLSPGTHNLNDFEQIKKDLSELKENFGEFMPQTQLVLGKNEKGEIVTYIIQERIEGKNLTELPFSAEAEQQLIVFLKKAVDVYIKNLQYKNSSPEIKSILPDIQITNFIFGVNKKDTTKTNKLYFIDSYPVSRITPQHFLKYFLPLVIKSTPPQWMNACEEFKREAESRINQYLAECSKMLQSDYAIKY